MNLAKNDAEHTTEDAGERIKSMTNVSTDASNLERLNRWDCAWQMFKDSLRVLKTGAELRIVGNRQLAYHVKLKRLFGNCETIASNKKFVILSAIKR